MKKLFKIIASIALILIVLPSLSGCTLFQKSIDYDGYLWNNGDRSKHLRKFDPIMDEIPRDYLRYLNLNPDDYNIGTLEQWSTSNLGTSAAYHSYVYKKGDDVDSGFYIWALDDGRVNDTRFLKELETAVQEYFAQKIEKEYPGVRVMVSLDYHNMPSKEWKVADGIDNFLNSKDEYLLFIYVVYGTDVNFTEADVETLKSDLAYLNDVKALFYRLEGADTVEKKELTKLKEEFSFYEHK